VISIGREAFRDCIGLTSVTIPDSVTSIGEGAFKGCFGLTSILIPDSVTYIGDSAFDSCIGLTTVTLPNSVTTIGMSMFSECTGLTSVVIPNSVTSIGNTAFEYCTSLTSVTIPNSVTYIGGYAFYNCESLTSVVIPNAVTYIGESAFRRCTGLTEVVIGESVTEIGEQAFRHCSNLAKVVNLNTTPQKLVYDEFDGIADEAVLYVPSGSVDAYKAAEGWSVFSDIRGMGAFEVALSAETLEIAEGEYAKIDAKIVKDDDVTVESEEWSSSDSAVAVVKDGVVTAVAPGKAVITYTAVDNYGAPHTASCVVTVTDGQNSISEIGDDADATVDVYTLQGVAVIRNAPAADIRSLPAGLYIIRTGNATRKIAVK
ncbi:MAG: leucine-rich repeat domain-containing protein, partial [Muribaculaceae bacterium]|nr:leucine-rich repeat domain-containing protein [Muribaculaceae bacterium]